MYDLKLDVMNKGLDYLSFILRLRSAMKGETLLKVLFEQSEKEWNNSVDGSTGRHLIKDVYVTRDKTDAVRIYIAKLIKLHMASESTDLTAWTKDTLASENATNLAISNRIAAVQFKSNRDLFILVVTRLMGYDDSLVKFALSSDENLRAKLLVNFLSEQFNLTSGDTQSCKLYIDQTVQLAALLKTRGLTADFFSAHVLKHADLININSNFWDVFYTINEAIEVSVEVEGTNELYDELSAPTVTAEGTAIEAFVVEIHPDDTDILATIEICTQNYTNLLIILPPDIEYDSSIREELVKLVERVKEEGILVEIQEAPSELGVGQIINSLK